MALPLLWVAHRPGLEELLSAHVRNRIKDAYNGIHGEYPAEWKPVKKVALIVTRVENQLVVDEMVEALQDQAGDNAEQLNQAQAVANHRDQLQAILNQKHQLRQQITEAHMSLSTAISALHAHVNHRFSIQAGNINRLRATAYFAPPSTGTA